MLPLTARALVADAGTRWAFPAAVPLCCAGPLAYPNIRTAGPPPFRATGSARAAGAPVIMQSEATVASATTRVHALGKIRPCRDDQRAMMNP
jgi:hypothetical protein